MRSVIIIITAISLSGQTTLAQSDSAKNSTPGAEAPVSATDSTPAKSTLTTGLVYANNANYYGQEAEESTPYLALAATYRFKSGFYLSGLAYRILTEKKPSVSASSLGAGVEFKLGKKLSADLSYNHSFYPTYSPLLQAANPDNGSLALTYESWLNISLTGDYAFGKTSDAFATAAFSKSVNLFSLGKKDIISINPSADVVAGTQHFYQTYLAEKKLIDSALGILTGPLLGNPPSGGGTDKTVQTTAFNLLSYNFKFPLSYNRAHYVLEANYQLSVLSSEAQSGAGKTNSFLTFSFYYQF